LQHTLQHTLQRRHLADDVRCIDDSFRSHHDSFRSHHDSFRSHHDSFCSHPDSFMHLTWLSIRERMSHGWVMANQCVMVDHDSFCSHHDSSIHPTWLSIRIVTHSRMWHDSFTHVTWLIHARDMTHAYMTWPIHTWRKSSICGLCVLLWGGYD